ncbi:LysR substrate-binding domain-containing protein [Chitinasiproducens palmae]
MTPIDQTTLRLFIAVCEEGTIARAASREAITASAVSKRIADVEAAIGTPLLVRSQRGVAPTPAGSALLERARAIMLSYERLSAELGEYAQGIRGHVKVLANVSSLIEFLPAAVAAFMNLHPQVRVDLEERVSGEVARGVEEGVADLGVCRDFVGTGRLETIRYRADHLVVAVRRDHPLAGRGKMAFEETLGFDHIGLSSNASVNALMDRIASERGGVLRYRAHVSNFDAACRMIEAGIGIAILPLEALARVRHVYGLETVLLDAHWARRQFILCVRERAALSLPAARLLEHLLATRDSAPD